MNINIITLFPKMFKEIFNYSIVSRAKKNNLVKINVYNLRDWTRDKHKTVDDTPYGGGAGMILKVDVIDNALDDLRSKLRGQRSKVILLTPKGKTLTQKKARTLSRVSNLILVCGHYGGFDERVRKLVDEEISIGNYVLTGGEIPAMVLVDSISRLVSKVINPESLKHESFSPIENCKLKIENLSYEYPQYTRPEIYELKSIKIKKPMSVPKILLSGNHAQIEKWRNKKRKAVS